MKNRYQELLSTGLKSRISQFNQEQIIDEFNRIQNLIDDYKVAIQYFLEEEKYARIYHNRINDFYSKILNPHQLIIIERLKMIDDQFQNMKRVDRLKIRSHPFQNKKNQTVEGGGAASQKPNKKNQQIFRQILDRFTSGETKVKSFYIFLHQSHKMFKDLQALLDPEKYTKIKDVLFFKEMIQKTEQLITLFQSILDIGSIEIYYQNVGELQDLIFERLKDYIRESKIGLQKNI